MAQSNNNGIISIQEVANILKLARQKTALGLYQESIRSYNHALRIISQHYKMQDDPFLKEQWKKTDEEIKAEVKDITKLYKALKELRGEKQPREEPMTDIAPLQDIAPKDNEAQDMDAPSQPGKMNRMLQHFGGVPFHKKEELKVQKNEVNMKVDNVVVMKENPPPVEYKKDPMIWDPPSPTHNQGKKGSKNLPGWAQKPGGPQGGAKPKHGSKQPAGGK
jgi:hypothetical protein